MHAFRGFSMGRFRLSCLGLGGGGGRMEIRPRQIKIKNENYEHHFGSDLSISGCQNVALPPPPP